MVVVMTPDATDERRRPRRREGRGRRRGGVRQQGRRAHHHRAGRRHRVLPPPEPAHACGASPTCTGSPTRTSWSAASTTAERSTVWVDGPHHRVPIGPDTFTFIAGPCAVESPRADARGRRDGQGRRARRCCAAGRSSRARRRTRSRGWGSRGLEILADGARRRPGCRSSPRWSTRATCRSSPSTPTCCRSARATWRTSGCSRRSASPASRCCSSAGMTATVEEWLMAAEYVAQRGNLDVVLCERGIRTFEPATRNTLDISAVPVVQATSHLPVIVDPSHAAGRKDLVVPLSHAPRSRSAPTASSSTCTPTRRRRCATARRPCSAPTCARSRRPSASCLPRSAASTPPTHIRRPDPTPITTRRHLIADPACLALHS